MKTGGCVFDYDLLYEYQEQFIRKEIDQTLSTDYAGSSSDEVKMVISSVLKENTKNTAIGTNLSWKHSGSGFIYVKVHEVRK